MFAESQQWQLFVITLHKLFIGLFPTGSWRAGEVFQEKIFK